MIEMWAFLTLLAVVIWGSENILDKHIVYKYIKNPFYPVVVWSVLFLFLGVIMLAISFTMLPLYDLLLVAIAGGLLSLTLLLYYKALAIEEISRIASLFYVMPIFTLTFATIFLNEIFTLTKYVGIFMLVSGAILISLRIGKSGIKMSKAFWIMVAWGIFMAASAVITKYLLNIHTNWVAVLAYREIFGSLVVFLFMLIYWKRIINIIKAHGRKAVAGITASASMSFGGQLMVIFAMTMGPVSLINALASVQPLFVLLITIILSLYWPKILQEEFKGSVIALKAIAITITVIGAILVM